MKETKGKNKEQIDLLFGRADLQKSEILINNSNEADNNNNNLIDFNNNFDQNEWKKIH